MDTIRGHIKRIPELLAPKIDTIKSNFDEWKVPWTAGRASKLDNLDANVSTRSTQASVDELTSNAGTVNAKLNAILQKQKVIRGVATFSVGASGIETHVIQLPQTINPEYASVSLGFITATRTDSNISCIVSNVTSTTVEIDYRTGPSASTVHIEWQVVGGLV